MWIEKYKITIFIIIKGKIGGNSRIGVEARARGFSFGGEGSKFEV